MGHNNLQLKPKSLHVIENIIVFVLLTTIPGVYCGQIYLMVNCLFYCLAAIYNMYKSDKMK